MIEIKITDPAKHEKEELIGLVRYLLDCAGETYLTNSNAHDLTSREPVAPRRPVVSINESAVLSKPVLDHLEENIIEEEFIPAPPQQVFADEQKPIPKASIGLVETPIDPNTRICKHEEVTATVELDANNMPWDARIHSSNKTKTTNGAWKYRRGVDANYLTLVETELKKIMQIEPAPKAKPDFMPVPPPPPPAQITFVELMMQITTSITQGKISVARVNALASEIGLPDISAVEKRPDLIPQLNSLFEKEIANV